MKVKDGFVLREVAGNYIVVAVGARVKEFNGIINLNETGAVLWREIEKGADEETLVKALLSEYEVEEEVAKEDVRTFIAKMKEAGLLI